MVRNLSCPAVSLQTTHQIQRLLGAFGSIAIEIKTERKKRNSPDLKFHSFSIQLYCSDFEIYSCHKEDMAFYREANNHMTFHFIFYFTQ